MATQDFMHCWLHSHGFVIGVRDKRLKPEHEGKYMVAQEYTDDDLGGTWAIVGNDLYALTLEAYDHWAAI